LAIVSFALALGFDGVITLIMCIGIAMAPNPGLIAIGLVSLFLLLTGSMATGLIVVARGRTRWTRRPVKEQWALAGTIFVAVGGLHALIGIGWISMWV
jgi:hypothetical protein